MITNEVKKKKILVLSGIILTIIIVAGIMPAQQSFASPYALQNPAGTNSTSGNTYTSSNNAITVTTDKISYNYGDTITITGSTQEYISGTLINFKIIDPLGNIVKFDQISLGSDRTFSYSVTATGALWQASGTYQAIVQYGSKDNTAAKTFQFTGSSGGPTNPNANTTSPLPTNNHSVTVSTNKQSYVTNDTITITGTGDPNLVITQYLAGVSTPVISKTPIAIQVIDSAGNLAAIRQLDLDDVGKYSTTILASDNWKNPGLYTVTVQQGINNKAQTQFWFNYNGGSIPEQSPPPTFSAKPTASLSIPVQSNPNTIISPTPTMSTIPTTPAKIPNWVKAVFGFYAQGNLSDDDLIKALQFLIQQGIIKLS
jgi:hypothetical protein